MHLIQHVVGVAPLGVGELVNAHDQQARHRQRPQQPGVRFPKPGCIGHAQIKNRPHKAAQQPGDHCKRQPFDERLRIFSRAAHSLTDALCPIVFHAISSLLSMLTDSIIAVSERDRNAFCDGVLTKPDYYCKMEKDTEPSKPI